jgi:hypothetical protein
MIAHCDSPVGGELRESNWKRMIDWRAASGVYWTLRG